MKESSIVGEFIIFKLKSSQLQYLIQLTMRYNESLEDLETPHFHQKPKATLHPKQFMALEAPTSRKERDRQNLSMQFKKIKNRKNMQLKIKSDRSGTIQLPTFGNWKDISIGKIQQKAHNPSSRRSLDLTIQFTQPNKQNMRENSNIPESIMLEAYAKMRSKQFKEKTKTRRRPKLVSQAQKHQIYDSISKRDIQSHERKRSIQVNNNERRQQVLSAHTSRSLQKQPRNNRFRELYVIQKKRYDKVVKRYGIDNSINGEFNQFLQQYA